jgi:Zn ribbon nucleic-acid-binding protein
MPPHVLWIICPKCRQRSGVVLPLNRVNPVESFECTDCGHFWTMPRPDWQAPTLPPRREKNGSKKSA